MSSNDTSDDKQSGSSSNGQNAQVNSNSTGSNSHGSSMNNVLKHIETLEKQRAELEAKLSEEKNKNQRLSQKTREGMQSALDTLMKKWMDAVETKDEKIKDQFKSGLDKLVQNSAEDNGVWQMMVAASALHERQTHDLDKLRGENNDLKLKIDGQYATPESRTDGKRKAEDQLDRTTVVQSETASMWDDFAKDVGVF